jgi:hypothetical protein
MFKDRLTGTFHINQNSLPEMSARGLIDCSLGISEKSLVAMFPRDTLVKLRRLLEVADPCPCTRFQRTSIFPRSLQQVREFGVAAKHYNTTNPGHERGTGSVISIPSRIFLCYFSVSCVGKSLSVVDILQGYIPVVSCF